MTCRKWLNENGYEDVVRLIDDAKAKMVARGSKQRRNWWDILSGGAEGKPCVSEGIEFPVLRVAQKRQGKHVTKYAISRNSREQPPELLETGRWKKERPDQNLKRQAVPPLFKDNPPRPYSGAHRSDGTRTDQERNNSNRPFIERERPSPVG